MVATASGNNYFSGTSYDGGSGRQRSDSRQLGRYEWIATYEGLSIYGHTWCLLVSYRPLASSLSGRRRGVRRDEGEGDV